MTQSSWEISAKANLGAAEVKSATAGGRSQKISAKADVGEADVKPAKR
jgi:hypothetical protein